MDACRAAAVIATVRRIVGYLERNPQGSDTLEGIARWWLEDETMPMDQVKRALDWMQDRGLLKVVAAADGRLRYRRDATDAAFESALSHLPPDGPAPSPPAS